MGKMDQSFRAYERELRSLWAAEEGPPSWAFSRYIDNPRRHYPFPEVMANVQCFCLGKMVECRLT
jgi:hypothetical protein